MFKIRSLKPRDFEILKKLFKEKENEKLLQILHSSTAINECLFFLQPIIPYNFRGLPSIHLIIEKNNILGYAIVRCLSKPNNAWQIDEVFVLDEIRNEGLGEELIRYILSLYGGYGIEHFLAEIDSNNHPALTVFHQCGFRRFAKVYFYKKEIDTSEIRTCSLDTEFIIRTVMQSDFPELEKLEVSSIPPDLRQVLGKSKEYFKDKKDSIVIIDKKRNHIIGWSQIQKTKEDSYFIELLASPGWTHLYEEFLNTIISDLTSTQNNKAIIIVKAPDYITEFCDVLKNSGFLPAEVKELLVKTIWQKVKERKRKEAKVGVPSIQPT